jgi:hypothetical protein
LSIWLYIVKCNKKLIVEFFYSIFIHKPLAMHFQNTLILSVLLLSIFSSCRPAASSEAVQPPDAFAHIREPAARQLLQNAIQQAGGLEQWENKIDIKFKKYFALYDDAGQTEQATYQAHHYTYHPEEKINISWGGDSTHQQIIYERGIAQKMVDGAPDTTAKAQALMNTINSATFVISIPFKLLDAGTNLTYTGKDTLEDGTPVEVLRAIYQPEKFDNLTTPDTWWHYYDAKDYTLVGYMVQHADHYSYVRNIGQTRVGGILFPTDRESYRVDSLRNKLYLRAKYRYDDYEVLAGN